MESTDAHRARSRQRNQRSSSAPKVSSPSRPRIGPGPWEPSRRFSNDGRISRSRSASRWRSLGREALHPARPPFPKAQDFLASDTLSRVSKSALKFFRLRALNRYLPRPPDTTPGHLERKVRALHGAGAPHRSDLVCPSVKPSVAHLGHLVSSVCCAPGRLKQPLPRRSPCCSHLAPIRGKLLEQQRP